MENAPLKQVYKEYVEIKFRDNYQKGFVGGFSAVVYCNFEMF